jgi:hypothetical protein
MQDILSLIIDGPLFFFWSRWLLFWSSCSLHSWHAFPTPLVRSMRAQTISYKIDSVCSSTFAVHLCDVVGYVARSKFYCIFSMRCESHTECASRSLSWTCGFYRRSLRCQSMYILDHAVCWDWTEGLIDGVLSSILNRRAFWHSWMAWEFGKQWSFVFPDRFLTLKLSDIWQLPWTSTNDDHKLQIRDKLTFDSGNYSREHEECCENN